MNGAEAMLTTARDAGIERFGYFPEQAAGVLDGIDHVVLVGAPDPVAMFGWPGAASRLVPEHVQVVMLADAGDNVADALAAVADAFPKPARSARIAAFDPPPVPSGRSSRSRPTAAGCTRCKPSGPRLASPST